MQKTNPGSRAGFAGSVFCPFLLPALIIAITITALSTVGLCSSPPSPPDLQAGAATSWPQADQAAWEFIRAGKPANMEDLERGKRTISPEFFSNILLYKEYSKAIGPKGVHLIGALFDKKVDLSHFRLDCPLVFEKCIFGDKVNLSYITSSGEVRIVGCTFKNDVDIGGARINGSLDIASFGGGQTDDPLTPNRFEGVLMLKNATINGQVFIGNSTFAKDINMDDLRTDTFVQLSAIRCDGEVTLGSSRPTQVNIEGGSFAGDVEMKSMDVDGNVHIYGADDPPKFKKELNLAGSHIAGGLYFWNGAAAETIDISGTDIQGELWFSNDFIEQSRDLDLILHNAQIGKLSFPPTVSEVKGLDLVGCEYSRLNWIEENGGKSSVKDVSWLWDKKSREARKFVKKCAVAGGQGSGPDMEYYSAQPYQQLAAVLKQEGRADLANDVLFAGKEAERKSSGGLQWWLLTMELVTIGYGYKYRYVLAWTSFFIIVGFLMIWANAKGKCKVSHFIYSLDMLLPILQLDKTNYDTPLEGHAKYYFYVHRIAGYLLASFIIAGISGLIK
jgi:hypothetical protein